MARATNSHYWACLAGCGLLLLAAPNGVIAQESLAPELTGEEFRIPVDERMAADIDELIADLGAPEYEKRVAATDGLIEIGAPAFAKLRETYHGTDDLEVRLRIERIVFSSFLDHHVYSRHAFLGIQLQRYIARDGDELELPRGTGGVRVSNVIENTAAERAGLLENDVIIGADGEMLPPAAADPVTLFSRSIAARPPGAHMLLTVARTDGVHELDVTLGRCPRDRVQQTRIREKYDEAAEQFKVWWKRFFMELENTPD